VSSPRRRVEYLLIGGGIASAYCADALRKKGADGPILIVGREPEPPYDRPPLSKDYVRGESSREDAYVKPRDWYEENGIELLAKTSVMSLDADQRVATLQGKQEVAFEKALLATGANVNILRVDGAELDGIHYLRTFANSDAIREDGERADHVVLVGGSYIGSEVAASLRATGTEATIVMLEDVALERAFGQEVGRHFHEVLDSHGVTLHGGEELEAFEGSERVEAVRTKSGLRIECDAVVVGAGVRPDVMLAQRAGIEIGNGIDCDETLQTSVPGIYAAGDVASWPSAIHGGERLRVEHWDVAIQHGKAVAANMLGEGRAFEEVPYFFSDLADWSSMEYVGPANEWDEVVWRGSREDGEFTVWFLHQGRVAAALTVGRSDDLMHARRLIASRADVAEHRKRLADPAAELEEIS
jgi:3-phenylpropionate/trans-cinnamate dioxygenase ferredoxin reductase component